MSNEIATKPPFTEAKARSVARRFGLKVCKSRKREYYFSNQGKLQLVDPVANVVIAGVNYECTPEEIIYFAEQYNQR